MVSLNDGYSDIIGMYMVTDTHRCLLDVLVAQFLIHKQHALFAFHVFFFFFFFWFVVLYTHIARDGTVWSNVSILVCRQYADDVNVQIALKIIISEKMKKTCN